MELYLSPKKPVVLGETFLTDIVLFCFHGMPIFLESLFFSLSLLFNGMTLPQQTIQISSPQKVELLSGTGDPEKPRFSHFNNP